jgi:hypothetical protein
MPVESIQDDNQKFLNFFALWCEAISARRMRARKEQQAEKEVVAAEVRAMKKSARGHLKQKLLSDLENND